MGNINEIIELLRSKGLKVTPQRVAILQLLMNGGHFTMDQVLNELRKIEPNISISTVYNTLNTLVRLGILRSFEADGKTWYEMRKDPHINVICEDTGQIMDVDIDVSAIEREVSKLGIEIKDLNVIIRGNCRGTS
ncbi:Fur family transcriptional regulator [Vulcanisaeta distributa]|uniref:Ferric uptake regulator, Fur family n=1 Tax=Vulcanisaeta distributa (strain DSM 14429 / JCM 11212 / NBRC 100878 / IC-017) TaxID=572478 RepID=E1QQD1_VULDI|nr:Fur family transcriptional regulator [Vulcanisaeta distributa]ADN51618.1 ferric uptake regulator, Fur family [Vulcanisaeta distributa DSM 14429]